MYPDYAVWPVLLAKNAEGLIRGMERIALIPGLSAIFSNWYIQRVKRNVSSVTLCNRKCLLVLGDEQVIPLDDITRVRAITPSELRCIFGEASALSKWNTRLTHGLHIALHLVEFTRLCRRSSLPSFVPQPIPKPILLPRYRDQVNEMVAFTESFISLHNKKDASRFLYIAGTPGTGKSSWARWCIEQVLMKTDWEAEQIKPVFTTLCCARESLRWKDIMESLQVKLGVSTTSALASALTETNIGKKRAMAFLVLDELDLLDVGKRHHRELLKYLVRWTGQDKFALRFFVLATGNSFDISKTGINQPTTIQMPSYDSDELEHILREKHSALVAKYESSALRFLSKRIGNEGGDVRKAATLLSSIVDERTNSEQNEAKITIVDVKRVMDNGNLPTDGPLTCLALLPKFLVVVVTWLTRKKHDRESSAPSCKEVKDLFFSVVSRYYGSDEAAMVDDCFQAPADAGFIGYKSAEIGTTPDDDEEIVLSSSVTSVERQFDGDARQFYQRIDDASLI